MAKLPIDSGRSLPETQDMRIFILILFVLFAPGCASIFAHGEDAITFDSEPQGAEVYFHDELLGKTPFKAELPRQLGSDTVQYRLAGYETEQVVLQKGVEPIAFFNFGFITTTFGATSWGIDAATGKVVRYRKKAYTIELRKKGTASTTGAMEYVILNAERLRDGIARGTGAGLRETCDLEGIALAACDARLARATSPDMREKLLAQPDGLELYRSLKRL